MFEKRHLKHYSKLLINAIPFVRYSRNTISEFSDDPDENLGWLAETPLEQEDVWLWLVDHVVDPARALGHTHGPPLCL